MKRLPVFFRALFTIRAALAAENLALRQQLAVLQRSAKSRTSMSVVGKPLRTMLRIATVNQAARSAGLTRVSG